MTIITIDSNHGTLAFRIWHHFVFGTMQRGRFQHSTTARNPLLLYCFFQSVPSRQIRLRYGSINRKIAARVTDEIVHQLLINELKAVPKSISLANCRVNPHRSARKLEAQFHNFA